MKVFGKLKSIKLPNVKKLKNVRFKKPKLKLPKFKFKKINVTKKQGITFALVLGVIILAIAGRESPFKNEGSDVDELLSSKKNAGSASDLNIKGALEGLGQQQGQTGQLEQAPQDDNIYTAFYFEVFTLVKNYYWNVLGDEQLINVTKLALEKVSDETIEQTPQTKAELRELIIKKMKNKSDDEKEAFITALADVVLANLEPFGRSRLYTSKKKQELSNTVKNVNPDVDHYETLGVEKNAPPEQIADAYEEKITELNQQEKTPEVNKKIAQVKQAKEVLGDQGNKNVYDQSGANPTIENRLITPRIAYIHVTKFSPTTVEELDRVMQKYDEGQNLDTLIIDLRGNIGGAIDGLPYFLGPFIGQDQHAYQFFKRGEKQDFITKTGWLPSLVRYKRVVVLTDDQVQSSGEVFAAVLKKYNVGVLVGDTTKGWGTVEAVFKINNQIDPENETYSALLVHSLTLRDDGMPIEGKGVVPHVSTDNPNWQQEFDRYFNDQELLNAVSNLLAQ